MNHASFIAYLQAQKFTLNLEKKDYMFQILVVPMLDLIDSAILYHIDQLPESEQAVWKQALELQPVNKPAAIEVQNKKLPEKVDPKLADLRTLELIEALISGTNLVESKAVLTPQIAGELANASYQLRLVRDLLKKM